MRHFLEICDYTTSELNQLIQLALDLKAEWQAGGNNPVLRGKTLAMIFEKPSLRTRVSFDVAMQHLGGHAVYLGPAEIGLGKRESIADITRTLNGYTQCMMARVFSPAHLLELAHWSSTPVINGLTDHSHPCQALADVLTLQEHFGKVQGLKVAYVGDFNNVTRSLAEATALLGMEMRVGCPENYGPSAEAIHDINKLGGLKMVVTQDPIEAVSGVDVIYTDTWVSMGQEAETEQRRQVFPPYQVNAALLSKAAPGVVVLHCLPAHRGDEITDEVADSPQSLLFPQAANRLHAQKAVLVKLLTGTN